jgi:TonB family protein
MRKSCSALMQRYFGILILLLLSLPTIASGQSVEPNTDVFKEPREVTPLKSRVHYPEEARLNRVQGDVLLEALIGKDGSVMEVNVVESSDTVFNTAAIRALKLTRFQPAMVNDTPVEIWITRAINFRLNPNAEQADALGRTSSNRAGTSGDTVVSSFPHEIIPLGSLVHYPKEARKSGKEGRVMMRALVGKDGFVSSVSILKSTDTVFNQEAIHAFQSARFKPALRADGMPVLHWITRTINFRLKPRVEGDSTGSQVK